MAGLELVVGEGRYAVCRLPADAPAPTWADGEGLVAVVRTADELSVVCDERRVPADVRCEDGFACLSVVGPLDFALTGVLAGIATALADAHVPLLAVSTFDTDHVLVRADDLARAVEALGAVGMRVTTP